jgi:hypothetical protein
MINKQYDKTMSELGELRIRAGIKGKADIEKALDLLSDFYLPQYRDHHRRAIVCFGLDRWLEIAEKAQLEGKVPAKYFSFLVRQEWQKYNLEKQAHNSQIQK